MRFLTLGAAAGGGLPQWNCGCTNCAAARAGDIPQASQSSVAVTLNGADWAILNASPDLRSQLAATPALHPRGLRDSPVRAVLVTNGDVDHIAGLISLRESQPFDLFATAAIQAELTGSPVFNVMSAVVTRRTIAPGHPFDLLPGLTATLFPVPGKVPLYQETGTVITDQITDQTVGVELTANGRRALYIPGCARVTDDLRARIDGADLLFFDGTLWRDDEMMTTGTGTKTGARMGHLSIDGPDGSIAALSGLTIGQRIFIHLNNTNPALDPRSPERAIAQAAGWQIAFDGQEIAP